MMSSMVFSWYEAAVRRSFSRMSSEGGGRSTGFVVTFAEPRLPMTVSLCSNSCVLSRWASLCPRRLAKALISRSTASEVSRSCTTFASSGDNGAAGGRGLVSKVAAGGGGDDDDGGGGSEVKVNSGASLGAPKVKSFLGTSGMVRVSLGCSVALVAAVVCTGGGGSGEDCLPAQEGAYTAPDRPPSLLGPAFRPWGT
ncbi:hypothetical protein AGDE_12904 [Angomonas deanei]|nr:hypothetical protein AGDE_12904 [Angomonas deanei]|eukprot:EPY23309.1 hypothetical protein AGDE_12904 [Angomonas deanei]